MANETMKIHHLRVMNFDKDISEKKSEIHVKSDKIPVVNKKSNRTKDIEKSHYPEKAFGVPINSQAPLGQVKRERHVRISPKTEYLFVKNPKYVHKLKSKSGIFMMPTKKKVKKKHKRNKLLNLYELKRTLSHHSSVCTDRFKEKIQTISRDIINSKWKRKRDKDRKNVHKRNDDIKVLFTRETSKLKEATRRDSSPKRLQSFDDIFGFRRSKRLINPLIYQQSSCFSSSHCVRLKRKKNCPKLRRVASCEHYPLKLLTSKIMSKPEDSCYPVHKVNLVEFPHESNKKICWDDSKRPACPKNRSFHECPSTQRRSGGCGDVAVSTSPVRVCSGRSKPAMILEGPPCQPRKPCEPEEPCEHVNYSENGFDIKLFLKSIVLGMVILVWLPCILAVLFCWLITYPLRPHWIRARAEKTRCYTKCYSHRLQRYKCDACKNRSRFWSSFVRWIKGAEWTNARPYEAIASLLKGDHEVRTKCHSAPNPNRQYTLYHTPSRGWVMKPKREQRQPCTEVRALSCEACMKVKPLPEYDVCRDRVSYLQPPPACHEYFWPTTRDTQDMCPSVIACKGDGGTKRQSSKLRFQEGICPAMEGDKPTKSCTKSDCRPVKLWTDTDPEIQQRPGDCTESGTQMKKPCSGPCKKRGKSTYNPKRVGLLRYAKSSGGALKKTVGQKICACWRNCRRDLAEAERDAWPLDVECGNMYVQTLHSKPCFWLYRCCPSMYPCFMTWHKGYKSCCYFLLYVLSACVWCPPLCCCYMCYEVICQCM